MTKKTNNSRLDTLESDDILGSSVRQTHTFGDDYEVGRQDR
jgi:hypothetical protein